MELKPLESNVRSFEMFIKSLLQEDLKSAYQCRENFKQEIIEFADLKHSIELMLNSTDVQTNGLQTTLNIGCDFFVDASVRDTSKILLNIGANVFIECSLEEAIVFIEKKESLLEYQIEYMTSKVAQIEGYISLYTASIALDGSSSPTVDLETDFIDMCNIGSSPTDTSSSSATEFVQNSLLNTLKSRSA